MTGSDDHVLELQKLAMSSDELNPTKVCFWDFYEEYLIPGKPVILSEEWTRSWRIRTEWVMRDAEPNYAFIKETFGHAVVPVLEMNGSQDYEKSEYKEMRLAEYIEAVETGEKNKAEHAPILYLKDWHFTKAFPAYGAYTVPCMFQSDWMNEYWDHKNDAQQGDYRFLYFGMKNSWTPFHADVLRSFSWSANICGDKLWYLVPPGNERLFAKQCGTLLPDIRTKKDLFVKAGVMEIVQKPGQIIFVPSGWHHQVHNLSTVISINHNWFNGSNILHVHDYLKNRLKDVRVEIADCKDLLSDYEAHCQLMLKADAGIDFQEFGSLLKFILDRRKNDKTLLNKDSVNECCCFCEISRICNFCNVKLCTYDIEQCELGRFV